MTTYFGVLTRKGAALIATALAEGKKLEITRMAVGDGGGQIPMPSAEQTELVNEVRRGTINAASVDPKNPSVIVLEQVIPSGDGGYWIREMGAFDNEGNLIAVANMPETYKARLGDGISGELVIRMDILLTDTSAITLKIDPSLVLATREYVDERIRTMSGSIVVPDASTTKKGIVQLSSATDSDSEDVAATPKAVSDARTTLEQALRQLALQLPDQRLGAAAFRDVGTADNQIPDMSAWILMGNAVTGAVRFPNGFQISWQEVTLDPGAKNKIVFWTYPPSHMHYFVDFRVTKGERSAVEIVDTFPPSVWMNNNGASSATLKLWGVGK